MGNCQAAEMATVVIQHPGGRVERIYWSVSASDVMASNPGHYVAVIITSIRAPNGGAGNVTGTAAAPVKHLKLLRPDDTLHIGHVYRLVSFEEVLKEFASKKHMKLSRLRLSCKEKGGGGRVEKQESSPATESVGAGDMQLTRNSSGAGDEGRRVGGGRMTSARQGQWRPALQSIEEISS